MNLSNLKYQLHTTTTSLGKKTLVEWIPQISVYFELA